MEIVSCYLSARSHVALEPNSCSAPSIQSANKFHFTPCAVWWHKLLESAQRSPFMRTNELYNFDRSADGIFCFSFYFFITQFVEAPWRSVRHFKGKVWIFLKIESYWNNEEYFASWKSSYRSSTGFQNSRVFRKLVFTLKYSGRDNTEACDIKRRDNLPSHPEIPHGFLQLRSFASPLTNLGNESDRSFVN